MPLLDSRLQSGQRLAQVQNRLIARREEEERQPSVVLAPTQSLPPTFLQPEVPSQPIEQQTLLQPGSGQIQSPQLAQPQAGPLDAISQIGSLASTAKTIGGLFGSGGLFGGGGAAAGGGSIGTVAGVPVGTSVGTSIAPVGTAGLPAGVAASLFSGLGGFAFPAAAVALPALNIATQGSRDKLKARIGFTDSGRLKVTDADAKGGLTSRDADQLGNEATSALDKVRRELGAEFNPDIGDFGIIGGSPGRYRVQDINFIRGKGDPGTGVIGTFSSLDDAKDAFVVGALRSGALKGDQAKIDAKIAELAPVFKKDRFINQFQDTGIVGGTKEVAPPLNQFLQAIKETDDPASILLQPQRRTELIPNPNFVGGPNESQPLFISAGNPFLQGQVAPTPRPTGFLAGV